MSHVDESCLIWMSHVTCQCVTSHVNASCHIWRSHVTCECVMSHGLVPWARTRPPDLCNLWMSHVIREWVMSHAIKSCHVWMSAARTKWQRNYAQSGHVKLRQLSHVTYTTESCHTFNWVMSHIHLSHVTNTTASYHTCNWVTSHIQSTTAGETAPYIQRGHNTNVFSSSVQEWTNRTPNATNK